MIDPNVSASMRIWPARNVSGGKHTACTGLETGIHDDATVDDKTRPYGKFYSRQGADTSDDEIAFEDVSASQNTLFPSIETAVSRRWRLTPCSS